jgi:hypothetical protein
LIVKQIPTDRIEELIAFLTREAAEANPKNTVTLSVISGTSLLAFTRFSESTANVMRSVVRLFT